MMAIRLRKRRKKQAVSLPDILDDLGAAGVPPHRAWMCCCKRSEVIVIHCSRS
jgi:hypothetical protein